MATLNPIERRRRDRVEGLIRVMAPAFDLLLAVGDRVSRVVERGDDDYYPPRVATAEPLRRVPSESGRS